MPLQAVILTAERTLRLGRCDMETYLIVAVRVRARTEIAGQRTKSV
jgi:hypothetical protein